MKRLIKIINAAFIGLLFSTLGLAGHASAMPMGIHGSMEHKTVSSVNCAAICLSATSDKRQEIPPHDNEEDEPELSRGAPYHGEFDPFAEPEKLPRTSVHDETILRPPDLVKLFANFRF